MNAYNFLIKQIKKFWYNFEIIDKIIQLDFILKKIIKILRAKINIQFVANKNTKSIVNLTKICIVESTRYLLHHIYLRIFFLRRGFLFLISLQNLCVTQIS